MNIINFIENDAKRIRKSRKLNSLIISLIILISILIGYGTRGDFVEAFVWYNIIPTIALAILVIMASPLAKRNKWTYKFILTSFFVVSLLQTQTMISLQKFENISNYWKENFHCLEIGFLGGMLLSICLSSLIYYSFPLQSKKGQIRFSLFIALAPTLLLSMHCPGPLRSHIIISHWGSSLASFIVSYLTLKFLTNRRINYDT